MQSTSESTTVAENERWIVRFIRIYGRLPPSFTPSSPAAAATAAAASASHAAAATPVVAPAAVASAPATVVTARPVFDGPQ